MCSLPEWNNLKFTANIQFLQEGKLQMYNLGAFLQSRYKVLLGDFYSPKRLYVRSSDNDRCLMSAGALLAGLQPPSAAEIWLPGLNWQPIPVHATPRNLDKVTTVKCNAQYHHQPNASS